MQRVCQPFERHIEAAVPGYSFRLVAGENSAYFTDLGGGVFPHVGWLVELPHFCLGDLVVGGGDERAVHVVVGGVVADVFIGEFVVLKVILDPEGHKSAMSAGIATSESQHDGASGVEVPDGELYLSRGTYLRRR